MGKVPQLPSLQPGRDGGHSLFGFESKSRLSVPVLSPGRLRAPRHHHRCQVSVIGLWLCPNSRPRGDFNLSTTDEYFRLQPHAEILD